MIGVVASDRVSDLKQRFPGGTVLPVQTDLSVPEAVKEMGAAVESHHAPLKVAALDAGRSLGGAFIDTDLEDELAMLALNVTGQFRLAKHVTRHMASNRTGDILITSSLSATTPTPYESIYGLTRAFMYSFTQGLRQEIRDHDVSVTALLSGATATEFHARAGMQNTAFGDNSRKKDPALVAKQAIYALFAGKDHVIGGGPRTRRNAIKNRLRPEEGKARLFGELSKPR